MGRRRVAVGDTIKLALPEVGTSGLMMRIGGEVRTVRILAGHVQILEPDGVTAALKYYPPFEVAGVKTDRLGLWVEPVPMWLTQVFRYGAAVSVPMTHAVHAVRWLEGRTSFDPAHALRCEGYEIREIRYRD